MRLTCPHCLAFFARPADASLPDQFGCPRCGGLLRVIVKEAPDGPVYLQEAIKEPVMIEANWWDRVVVLAFVLGYSVLLAGAASLFLLPLICH